MPPDRLGISLETAHPAKFPEEIVSNLGITPEVPAALVGLDERPEDYAVMPADYDAFREVLLDKYGRLIS